MATKKKTAGQTATETRVYIGNVYVESGQVMILDPCYARERENHEETIGGVTLTHGPGKVEYERACDLAYEPGSVDLSGKCNVCNAACEKARTSGAPPHKGFDVNLNEVFKHTTPHSHGELTDADRRQIGYGVVSTTEVGDGTFPVFAIHQGRRLVGLEVRFQR